jgi:hypothetical protein
VRSRTRVPGWAAYPAKSGPTACDGGVGCSDSQLLPSPCAPCTSTRARMARMMRMATTAIRAPIGSSSDRSVQRGLTVTAGDSGLMNSLDSCVCRSTSVLLSRGSGRIPALLDPIGAPSARNIGSPLPTVSILLPTRWTYLERCGTGRNRRGVDARRESPPARGLPLGARWLSSARPQAPSSCHARTC